MSLSGAMNTAVSGLAGQSVALSSISNNVANSQTTGFKQTDTTFESYLTESNANVSAPGTVVARPQYTNDQQGTIVQVNNPTSLAIAGQGFFPVQQQVGQLNGKPIFNAQQFYTRAGDFVPNSLGNLVNSTGYTLDGFPAQVTSGGVTTFNKAALVPVQIDQSPSPPVATTTMSLAANLPSTPPAGATSFTSTQQIYDPLGNTHDVTMNWQQVLPVAPATAATNQYTLTINATGSSTQPTTGPLLITFGTGAAPAGNGAAAGTILSIAPAATDPANTVPSAAVQAAATATSATPAAVNMNLNYGTGAQPLTLNLGTFQSANGITQYSGSTFAVTSQTQDGLPQGNYTSVSVSSEGNVVANYDNGATKVLAQVPLATFSSPDSLQAQDGETFTQTLDSGTANLVTVNTEGSGKLVTGAIESSNVDIASQFTQMIIAQRAYTANTKMISTVSQLLQDTLNMVQG